MQQIEEPATETQMNQLRRLGLNPDHPLTRAEAAQLMFEMGHSHPPGAGEDPGAAQHADHHPFYLRKKVQESKAAMEKDPAAAAPHQEARWRRQEFWIDTCREVSQMQLRWPIIMALYREHGCRFFAPNHEQTQEILDALDTALPSWDWDHLELFYQTLELNFPNLLHRH